MWSNTDVKPVRTFETITKDQNLGLFLGPEWPPNQASEAHILYTSKSIVTISIWNNTGVKPIETILRIWSKTDIF